MDIRAHAIVLACAVMLYIVYVGPEKAVFEPPDDGEHAARVILSFITPESIKDWLPNSTIVIQVNPEQAIRPYTTSPVN
jgi:hypothetical protein